GLTYVVIGDGAGGLGGTVEAAVDLTGFAIAADGLFLAAESSLTQGTADATLTLPFENGDNVTHLLVSDFTGAVADDLDTDDDGTLDSMPWTAILDGFALFEETAFPPTGTEIAYANLMNTVAVGPDGNFVPAHVFRCDDGPRIGDFGTGAATETPGEPNFCPAVTTVFCSPGLPNLFSMDGSFLTLESASGGSIAANDSTIVANDVPDEFGLFVQSDSIGAPVVLPQGGNLCLGSAGLQRLTSPILASGNQASYTLDFVGGGFEILTMPNATMYYQWWHRDGLTTANLSEGLGVTWID
ncbi:MAG: hypothetical protein AAFP86_01105, partial [Planctomycetota bacterium]